MLYIWLPSPSFLLVWFLIFLQSLFHRGIPRLSHIIGNGIICTNGGKPVHFYNSSDISNSLFCFKFTCDLLIFSIVLILIKNGNRSTQTGFYMFCRNWIHHQYFSIERAALLQNNICHNTWSSLFPSVNSSPFSFCLKIGRPWFLFDWLITQIRQFSQNHCNQTQVLLPSILSLLNDRQFR